MPTGYTAGIQNGIKFNDFVLRCARAFGATIHMRDDSLDAEIRYDKVSDYYPNRIETTKNNIANLKALTPEEREEKVKNEYNMALISFQETKDKKIEIKNKYNIMLKKVKAWTPPTDEHKKFKSFMIKQIEDSIEWDCKFYLFDKEKLDGDSWFKEEIKSLEKDLEYYQKSYEEECSRVSAKNKWIDDLFNSLK